VNQGTRTSVSRGHLTSVFSGQLTPASTRVSGGLLGPATADGRQDRASPPKLFPRVGFIVTTLTGTNHAVVRFYNQRGPAEQWIKEGKAATHWTRLSCHGFRANELRLLLGVIAYNVGNLLRRLVLPPAIQSWSLTSLQRRLFKTGGRLIRHARYFTLQLAESQLTRTLFRQILGRIERLASHPM
jgi:Transposase DDE domain group 1